MRKIEFFGDNQGSWVISKYMTEKIQLGSQLLVREGQTAVFMKEGVICDCFTPGTYTLTTMNLPLLSKVVNAPFHGKTPFSAEVFFVNAIQIRDILWGTADSLQIVDPKYLVKLRIRAFGQLGIQIVDGAKFIRSLIGSIDFNTVIDKERIKTIYKAYVVSHVKTVISKLMIDDKISAIELGAKLGDLSNEVRGKISQEFEQNGIAVISFDIQSLNFPEEDFAKINEYLAEKSAMNIIGYDNYMNKRKLDIFDKAAAQGNRSTVSILAGSDVVRGINSITGTAKKSKFCPNCGAEISETSAFCEMCGVQVAMRRCKNCNAELKQGQRFCSSCGTKVE